MKSYSPKFFIIIFFIIVSLPLAFFEFAREDSVNNRNISTFPNFPHSFNGISSYIKNLENWFNDRIGFKSWLISTYKKSLYEIFGISSSPYVAFGKNGTLFLHTHPGSDIIKSRYNEITFAYMLDSSYEKAVNNQYDNILKDANFAEHCSIPVIFVAVPTSPIYRYEDMPLFLKKLVPDAYRAKPPMLAAWETFQKNFPQKAKNFIYPYYESWKLKKFHHVYPEKNFHWTVSPQSLLIANQIASRFGIKPPENYMDYFKPCESKSDISHLAGFEIINQNDLCPNEKFTENNSPMVFYSGQMNKEFPFLEDDNRAQLLFVNEKAPIGARVFVMGDSFNHALLWPLSKYFKYVLGADIWGVRRFHKDNQASVTRFYKLVKEYYKPDLLIIIWHNYFFNLLDTIKELQIWEKKNNKQTSAIHEK